MVWPHGHTNPWVRLSSSAVRLAGPDYSPECSSKNLKRFSIVATLARRREPGRQRASEIMVGAGR